MYTQASFGVIISLATSILAVAFCIAEKCNTVYNIGSKYHNEIKERRSGIKTYI